MVAVAVERMYAETAKTRQGARTDLQPGGKSATKSGDETKARAQAATALNVSPRLVQEAKRVEAKAAPEVVAAVKAGRDWRKPPLVGTVAKCANLAGDRTTKRRKVAESAP